VHLFLLFDSSLCVSSLIQSIALGGSPSYRSTITKRTATCSPPPQPTIHDHDGPVFAARRWPPPLLSPLPTVQQVHERALERRERGFPLLPRPPSTAQPPFSLGFLTKWKAHCYDIDRLKTTRQFCPALKCSRQEIQEKRGIWSLLSLLLLRGRPLQELLLPSSPSSSPPAKQANFCGHFPRVDSAY